MVSEEQVQCPVCGGELVEETIGNRIPCLACPYCEIGYVAPVPKLPWRGHDTPAEVRARIAAARQQPRSGLLANVFGGTTRDQ